MLERAEELKQWVRETPLNNRLDDARRRIGKMCSEGRPPRMTIPVQYDDDDFYISTTLSDAQAMIADLQGQIAVERANKESAVACVDRDVKKISALQQRVAQLEMDNRTYINERHENMKTIEALQANYDRVLGLVQALPHVEGTILVHWSMVMWLTGAPWVVMSRYQGKYLTHGIFWSEDNATRFARLLAYRQLLPAQRAQGGA